MYLPVQFQYQKEWRVRFYGESHSSNKSNAENIIFRLGPSKVNKCKEYDHVSIKAFIFSSNVTGIKERLDKAKRTLNAISVIGNTEKWTKYVNVLYNLLVPCGANGPFRLRSLGDSII